MTSSQKEEDSTISYRIIMIGDSSAGKTSLAERYVKNDFYDNRLPTIGINKYSKLIKIEDFNYNIEIVDTMGQERYASLGIQFFRNCDGVILVYDVTNKGSYDNVENWLARVNENNPSNNLPLIILQNKIDKNQNEWQVTPENVKTLSQKLKTQILSVSALSGEGVEGAFDVIIKEVIKRNKDFENNKRLRLKNQKKKKKKCC